MEYFDSGLNWFFLAVQSVMQYFFICRLTERRLRAAYLPVFLLLVGGLELLAKSLAWPGALAIGVQLGVFYVFVRLALRCVPSVAGAAALLAVYITQLAFGMVNSAESLLFPRLLGQSLLYPLVLAATALALLICAAFYLGILKLLSLNEPRPYLVLLLLPGLFGFAAQLYILQTAYSFIDVNLSPAQMAKHLGLLVLQVLGLAALFCTLYAYRGICRGFQAQAQVDSLLQAAQAQKTYIAEAQKRYTQTRAFRHDVQNHLAVLAGLLQKGDIQTGSEYLQKLADTSRELAFAYQTGNPAVDVLLAEKLGLAAAEGIETEVELALPETCAVDNFDMCVIFANALDNAYQACRELTGEKLIRIVGERQGDFLRLEFVNTCREDEPLPPLGIGLSNIKAFAEKYQGTMLIEKDGGNFYLNVLLNLAA